ncbi:hypothetical protein Pla175_08890 [Pirellulimonas nuda]|uniref:Antitoxin FitA-like ribbon-helix-helix domain-containing protein n=1 Tax=Pirellulimonas nuda TaxID=2528009 RepID=A0A518D7S6_9BACT|nr:hypothetical protein [Pirellulimonas nuda]QDU87527.1 hypothetical protein Pla175_08890 [Pirellulimonas nuda]
MADILIRGLNPSTLDRLKRRAKAAGRSLQSETRLILEKAAGRTLDESLLAAARWRKKLGDRGVDSVQALNEDRDR